MSQPFQPPDSGATPQPPPPPHSGGNPPPSPAPTGAPSPQPGVSRPGELLDRFLARLVDGVLIGIVFGIVSAIGSAVFLSGFSYSAGEWFLYWLVVSVIQVAVTLGYFAYMESNSGQTVGKMLLKLKVLAPDGESPPTLEQALRRNAFYAIQLAFIVPIVGQLLGGLAMLAAVVYIAVTINNDTVRRQGWHDNFAGGTRVVKIG